MDNKLAENMLRFGVKNLSEASKKKLSEQTMVNGAISFPYTDAITQADNGKVGIIGMAEKEPVAFRQTTGPDDTLNVACMPSQAIVSILGTQKGQYAIIGNLGTLDTSKGGVVTGATTRLYPMVSATASTPKTTTTSTNSVTPDMSVNLGKPLTLTAGNMKAERLIPVICRLYNGNNNAAALDHYRTHKINFYNFFKAAASFAIELGGMTAEKFNENDPFDKIITQNLPV